MYGWIVGSSRRVSFVRPRVAALGVLLSLLVVASGADALTISNPGGNVSVPAGTVGDPNLVVTAGGTVTFAGRADADSLVVSSNGPISATLGEISAIQATFLTSGDNVTLSWPLNSIDRASIDTSRNTGALGDIVLNEQQAIVLDTLRGRSVTIASTGGSIAVTTEAHATAALTLRTTSGAIAIAGDTSVGANSSLSATSSIAIQNTLTVPSVRTGVAIQLVAPGANIDVTLSLGALGFVPTTETRLHVFGWQVPAVARTVTAGAGTLPALPARMTWDLSELSTTGDAVIRVCGDGTRAVTEACDDGNTVSGDGCDSTCHVEPPPPLDAGLDGAAPDGGEADDAGPDAAAPDSGVGGDAAADAGYGGKGGLSDDNEGIAAGIDIEGGACSFGPAASGASAPALLLGLAAAVSRRRRRRRPRST